MSKILIISIAVLVSLALIVCFVPLREEAYMLTVNYTEPATAFASLDYAATDYTEVEVTEEYRRTGSCGCNRELVEVEIQIACLNVTNTDDVAGQFLVVLTGLENGQPFSYNATLNLNASEQDTVKYRSEFLECWDFEVLAGWKEVETGELTTKQREELRYKRITILEYLRHYK